MIGPCSNNLILEGRIQTNTRLSIAVNWVLVYRIKETKDGATDNIVFFGNEIMKLLRPGHIFMCSIAPFAY